MKVAVNSLQKARGLTEWFQIVQPTLRPWLKVFDGLLKGVKPGQVFIYRSEETKELWEEFADLIESFRIMVARPELWAQDFTVSLVGLLAPEERLAIRSEAARLVWAGGDATLKSLRS